MWFVDCVAGCVLLDYSGLLGVYFNSVDYFNSF